ncbi:hypothetical protein [Saccharothrix syringae]|uniref:Uncharacterized protein n=1 Tax=Saccharothrix syringae TaxID=103733 RepID=A0A5Q0GTN0_SACSY|nr:hypothetical protein [Saccharothrix syringae]QFZ16722.1 hypothetical protein EKG83_03925 [Saccharothrix syringae]
MTPEPGTPDDRPPRLPGRGPARWWIATALGVVAAVVGVVLATDAARDAPPPDARVPDTGTRDAFGTGVATPEARPVADLVLRDGDTTRATGRVVAKDGGPFFCAPIAVDVDIPGRGPTCPLGVRVTGVGPMADAVQLEGVWRSGVLHVTGQSPSAPPSVSRPDLDHVPCAPPPGGWQPGGATDSLELGHYVNEHPDRFRMPRAAYPEGVPTATAAMGDAVVVLVVEVVSGDPTEAGRELRARHTGNLCVVDARGRMSMADQTRLQQQVDEVLRPLMDDQANGIFAAGGGGDRVHVDLVMVTPELAERFAPLGDGVELRPWLAPVR